MIDGGRPLLHENLVTPDPPLCNKQDEHRMLSLSLPKGTLKNAKLSTFAQ